MKTTTKFGLVALLDALGARTASIKSSMSYVHSIADLRGEIEDSIQTTLYDVTKKPQLKKLLADLHPRFFGDSLLLTYQVPIESHFHDFLKRMMFVLNFLMARALNAGILFRGALAVGEYIEEQDVALGPAVVDAAMWYEKPDFIGIITTPSTSNYLKAHFRHELGPQHDAKEPMKEIIRFEEAPITGGTTLPAFILDWPTHMDVHCDGDLFQWYLDKVKRLIVSPGSETKYINTEKFVKESLRRCDKAKEIANNRVHPTAHKVRRG